MAEREVAEHGREVAPPGPDIDPRAQGVLARLSARHGGGPVVPLPAQLVGLYVAPRAELQVGILQVHDADVGMVAEFAVHIVRGEYRDVRDWEAGTAPGAGRAGT